MAEDPSPIAIPMANAPAPNPPRPADGEAAALARQLAATRFLLARPQRGAR
jgi:hypothetical protein